MLTSTEKKQRQFEAEHKRKTQVRKETLIRNTRCTGSFSRANKIKPQTRRITVLGRATIEMAVGVHMAEEIFITLDKVYYYIIACRQKYFMSE